MDLAQYITDQCQSSHWTSRMSQYQRLLTEAIEHGVAMMDEPEGASVLDAGCGDGWSLGEWARHGCEPTGLDLSVEKAQMASARGFRVAVAVLGRDRLVWNDDTFDFVFSSHTLEHLPPKWQAQAASELHRVAKPGALGLVIVPYGHKRSPGHMTYFDREDELPALLRDAGFTVSKSVLRERLEPEQWIELRRGKT